VGDLPTGTVTFMFTDIEGSTRLLQEMGDGYVGVLAEHRRRLRDAFSRHGGVEVDTQGDAFFVVFRRVSDALAAAQEATRALDGPIRVRMGLHTGEPVVTDGGYVGLDVHRAARIAAAGHGGQVLVSQSTRDLARGHSLRDLGEHRLKGLTSPERIYQLGDVDFPPLNTLHQSNLPVQTTPLVGRKRELHEVIEHIRTKKLVTLTGAGGSGKTRLALQVAAELIKEFADGVWFVSLAAVSDASLVERTIASALGTKADLAEFVRGKQILLVLDNLEQLLPAVAPKIAALEASVLATSRERLNVFGEQEFPVPTLQIADAVALFTARARQLQPRFEPDERVVAIARRLEGLPLAVELAAARVKLLTPEQILMRLGSSLEFLTGGARDLPGRQQTLRATIEWSYDLLTPQEQRLFNTLSVFAGSFDLEAAQVLCEAELDTLQSLIDKSLLQRTDDARFFMLETIREYAAAQLESVPNHATAMHAAHAALVIRRVKGAEISIDRTDTLARLAADVANLRAALGWLYDHDTDSMLELAGSAWRFWHQRGEFDEGRQWLEQALERSEGSTLNRTHALRGLAAMLRTRDDSDRARALLNEALAIYRQKRNHDGVVRCLNNLGLKALVDQNLDEAANLFQSALALSRELAVQGRGPGTVVVLGNLADVAIERGDLVNARQLVEEHLLAALAEGSDVGAADASGQLAWLEALAGRHEDAAVHVRRVLAHARNVRGQHATRAFIVAAAIAAERGNSVAAARLLGAVEVTQRLEGVGHWDSGWTGGRLALRLQRELDESGYSAERAAGRDLSFADAIDLALVAVE
jgi:predicted ATPase